MKKAREQVGSDEKMIVIMIKTRTDKQVTYNAASDPSFTALNKQRQANVAKLSQDGINLE